MASRINAYRTADGKIFASQEEANEHEAKSIRRARVEALVPDEGAKVVFTNGDAVPAREYLIIHAAGIVAALNVTPAARRGRPTTTA